jgi:hypothetical protein
LVWNPADLFGGSFGFSLDHAHALRALLSKIPPTSSADRSVSY